MRLEAGEAVREGPLLGAVEERRSDSEPPMGRVDAGLVLEVREVALLPLPRVSDQLPLALGDPGVRLEGRLVERPPFAQLAGGEVEVLGLVEVRSIPRGRQRGDGLCVVKRRRSELERLQSGWPDSNRRLLAPKASTLTRLSYTPNLAVSVIRAPVTW